MKKNLLRKYYSSRKVKDKNKNNSSRYYLVLTTTWYELTRCFVLRKYYLPSVDKFVQTWVENIDLAKNSFTGINICHIAWSCYLEIYKLGQKFNKNAHNVKFVTKNAKYSNTVHATLFQGMLPQKRKQF